MIVKEVSDAGLNFIKCLATICVVLLYAGRLERRLNAFQYMADYFILPPFLWY